MVTFLIAAMVLTIAPGPDNLFILAQGLSFGRRPALFAAWGMCSGISVHTLAVSLGVAALLASSPVAFSALKIVGAGYLLWVAWSMWCGARPPANKAPASAGNTANEPASVASTCPSDGAMFRRGFLMNVLNPKVAIFFLALFPQFIAANDPHPVRRTLLLSLIFFLQAITIFSALAWFSGAVGQWLRSHPALHRAILRASALLVAALGCLLLVQRS